MLLSEQCRVKLTAGRAKSQGGVDGIEDAITVGPVGMMIINLGKFCDSDAEEDSSDPDSSAFDRFVVRRCLL